MLVGHSFAGLFALHVLWNHPESFDTYMALDPSLWWDQGAFLKQAGTRGDKTVFDGKQLYVAFATRPRTERNLIHFPLTDTFLDTVKEISGRDTRYDCSSGNLRRFEMLVCPMIFFLFNVAK